MKMKKWRCAQAGRFQARLSALELRRRVADNIKHAANAQKKSRWKFYWLWTYCTGHGGVKLWSQTEREELKRGVYVVFKSKRDCLKLVHGETIQNTDSWDFVPGHSKGFFCSWERNMLRKYFKNT